MAYTTYMSFLPRSHPGLVAAPTRLALTTPLITRIARLAWWPALILLTLYAVFYLQYALQLIAYPFGVDQGEGYDTWSAWLLRIGQLPYTNNDVFPYYSSNYPPLWSALASLPMTIFGPSIGAARAVSTWSTLLAAALIGLAAYRRVAGVRSASATLAGVLAGGLFLASPYVFHTTPLARVNSLALALALLALVLIEVPSRRRVLLAGLTLVAALFTKPTAVDAVATGVMFLALATPTRLPILLGVVVGLSGALFIALSAGTEGAFWTNTVVGNANAFDFSQLGTYLVNFVGLHGVLLVLATIEMVRSIHGRRWSPWVLFFPIALVMSLTVGKWGAGESYFLSVIAATSVLAGSALATLPVTRRRPLGSDQGDPDRTPRRSRSAAAFLGVALLVQLIVMSHGPITDALPVLQDRGLQASLLGRGPSPEDRALAIGIATRVAERPGLILSEEPGFLLAIGKPVIGNTTHLRNLYQSGDWDPAGLITDINARRFDMIVLSAQLFPPPVLAAIGRSYNMDYAVKINGAPYYLFVPNQD